MTTESDQKVARETSAQVGTLNSDGHMIKAIVISIMEDLINGGTFFKQGFVPFESLRIKPFFLMKHVIKIPAKSIQSKQR